MVVLIPAAIGVATSLLSKNSAEYKEISIVGKYINGEYNPKRIEFLGKIIGKCEEIFYDNGYEYEKEEFYLYQTKAGKYILQMIVFENSRRGRKSWEWDRKRTLPESDRPFWVDDNGTILISEDLNNFLTPVFNRYMSNKGDISKFKSLFRAENKKYYEKLQERLKNYNYNQKTAWEAREREEYEKTTKWID